MENMLDRSLRSALRRPGKTRGREGGEADLGLRCSPPKPCHDGIPPWTPKLNQSSLAGFSRSPQNRQNRKFSVCRALGKRLGSRFYQESARAKNKNGNSFTSSLRMVTLELRYQLD